MSDNPLAQHKYYEQELKKLEKKEAEKKLLYSKSATPAPKPSDDFIEKCVGRLKDSNELRTQARANVSKRIKEGEQEKKRQRDVRQSMMLKR